MSMCVCVCLRFGSFPSGDYIENLIKPENYQANSKTSMAFQVSSGDSVFAMYIRKLKDGIRKSF